MNEIIDRIKEDTKKRLIENKTDKYENLLYIDHKVFDKDDKLDVVLDKIEFDRPTYIVFVDEAPGMNWSHACHYLLYDADKGGFLKRIDAEFPYFMEKQPKTLELFQTCRTTEGYKRKKQIRVPLEPAKLSTWRKFGKLPFHFSKKGRRYAIFYSGHSNCRHVNDMEFLYRTLIDVYGYDPNDIYVVNYDGTLNWNVAGDWEPAAPCNYPVDGTPFRMSVNGQGNRTGFQNVINDLADRIGPHDCLLIHTNNHGGWDGTKNEGFMSGWGGGYYANDFASDLALLPKFNTLLAMMEPCHSGAFNNPILLSSPADRTVVQAAVPWNEGSAGGWPFDPWAEMWISAMAGVRGDGSALSVSADDNLDTLISAFEAFDYAIAIDNPVMNESSTDLSKNVFLSKCEVTIKFLKELKEHIKELKEPKEIKEFKEHAKEFKEIKEFKEYQKEHVKEFKEHKEHMEHGVEKYRELPEFQMTPEIGHEIGAAEIETRIERLEALIGKLTPFIESKLRPDLKDSAYKEEMKKKKEK